MIEYITEKMWQSDSGDWAEQGVPTSPEDTSMSFAQKAYRKKMNQNHFTNYGADLMYELHLKPYKQIAQFFDPMSGVFIIPEEDYFDCEDALKLWCKRHPGYFVNVGEDEDFGTTYYCSDTDAFPIEDFNEEDIIFYPVNY